MRAGPSGKTTACPGEDATGNACFAGKSPSVLASRDSFIPSDFLLSSNFDGRKA